MPKLVQQALQGCVHIHLSAHRSVSALQQLSICQEHSPYMPHQALHAQSLLQCKHNLSNRCITAVLGSCAMVVHMRCMHKQHCTFVT